MFYKAEMEETGRMWDTWLYYEGGTYYMYCLANTLNEGWNNISMATSEDGVHWKELGPVLHRGEGVTWMGTGSTWRSPNFAADRKFQINFSEWKSPRQTIFFAESPDLVHWTRLGDEHEFVQDERWYELNGRWDCIWVIDRPGGGLYGYWTASPKADTGGRFGFGESMDGVTWKALPPPKVEGCGDGEVGAVEKIGGRYYMMFGSGGHMVTLVADQPQGPFRMAPTNAVLFHPGPTYFARFFPTAPDGLLVNHHSIARDGDVYMGLLKTARLDKDGTLRLVWWPGNEQLKDTAVNVGPPSGDGPIPFLANSFDVEHGTTLEGDILLADEVGVSRGFFVEGADKRGAAILLDRDGVAHLGLMNADGTRFEAQITEDRGVAFRRPAHFRLLFNHSLLEFYLDDQFVECFSVPGRATGRVGLIRQGDAGAIRNLRAWSVARAVHE